MIYSYDDHDTQQTVSSASNSALSSAEVSNKIEPPIGVSIELRGAPLLFVEILVYRNSNTREGQYFAAGTINYMQSFKSPQTAKVKSQTQKPEHFQTWRRFG